MLDFANMYLLYSLNLKENPQKFKEMPKNLQTLRKHRGINLHELRTVSCKSYTMNGGALVSNIKHPINKQALCTQD